MPILPHDLGNLAIPDWKFPQHVKAFEKIALQWLYGDKRFVCVPTAVRHGKTLFWTTILPAFILLFDKGKKIVIVTHTQQFSRKIGLAIRKIIQEFGYLTGTKLVSKSSDYITTNTGGELYMTSITGSVRGRGANYLIIDDPHKGIEEVSKQERRDTAWTNFNDLLSRLEPDGRCVVIASLSHPDDIPSRCIALNPDLKPEQRFEIIKFPAINKDGTALWPERYSIDELRLIERRYIASGQHYNWSSQYMQDAMGSPEMFEFPQEYFIDFDGHDRVYYEELPPNVQPLYRFVACDPSKGKDAVIGCFSCSLYGIYDNTGTLWIEDVKMIRAPIPELESTILDQIERFKPDGCGIESNLFAEIIAQNVLKKVEERQINCAIYNIMAPTTIDKKVKIRSSLSPYLQQGRLKIKKSYHGSMLYAQLRQFPTSYLDGPDALCIMTQLIDNMTGG